MKATARLAGVAVLAFALAALFAATAVASPGHQKPQHPSHPLPEAVFVQTNDPAGNSVVAYDRASDGSLSEAGAYATGGLGGALEGAVVDRLASQGALTLDRESGLLYAVNAGSDTVTVFAVRGNGLQRRQVVRSGGDFPVSVAVHGKVVYVLNARGGGSVQGYIRFGTKLFPIRSWRRDLGLDPEAAPEFVNTPGQVGISPDGRKLLVTTKANGHAVDVFALNRFGGIRGAATVNELPETVPFAFAFDPRGRLVLTEAAGNVATFDVNGDGTLGALDLKETGGAATCWIVAIGSTFYASNTGSDTLSGYDVDGGGLLSALGDTSTGPAPIDAAASADGQHLYVQTGADGGVDEFRVNGDGSLTQIGSILVPGSAGGEGIAAS